MRRAIGPPLALVVAATATGWLYLVRPPLPGPRIGEALPLDELSRHASSPLLWYLIVWAAAGALLGGVARWTRADRLAAALVLGVTVGVFSYLQSGVSIAVVRQVSMRDALDTADTLAPVYLSAALVAIAVAVVAAPRTRLRRSHAIVATVVAAGAALDLFHAMLPGEDTGLLRSMTPDAVGPLAHAACTLVAVALLVAARGLARRRRRAWQVALSLAGLSMLLHVLHGFSHGTLVSAVLVVLLLARRNDFDGPGDATTRNLIARRLAIGVAAVVAYGIAALWLNRINADQPFTLPFALREIVRGVFGFELNGSPHLADGFGEWYPLSLLLLGAGATLWALAGWLAPWRHRVTQLEREREQARALVHAWGADTLAPFVLRNDKSYFFTPDEAAFLAYRVVGGVAIVSGDPIGPADRADELVTSFVEHARERDWRIAILGASEHRLPAYARHGLHALYHGDEAIVDTGAFTLEGRAIRKVRQSVHRLERAGYSAQVLRPSELDGALRAELQDVASDWRGSQPERGFVMALDVLFALGDEDAVFVVGFDPGGTTAGFLHFAVSAAAGALSLSSMPRDRDTPNGFNEWLICEAVAWARSHGFEQVSLNFAPFAALLAPEADLTRLQEVQRRALLSLKGHFQLDNLLAFNRKFFPRWERRFVVYERRRDLPRVGIAALAAEAYLPFQGERR
ncbi:MAG TPA: phosphatidylglycerol lysyltransferase domain-containing protein [Gaiellaceae bacterium]|nr:phosphatidylglycerol lysyltransferase domain-containing protein [Gaiellaceae bacterium]